MYTNLRKISTYLFFFLSSLATIYLFSVSMSLCFIMFVHLFCFLDPTCKWNQYSICLLLYDLFNLAQYPPSPSRSLKWQEFIFNSWVLFYCLYTTLSVSIYVWINSPVVSIILERTLEIVIILLFVGHLPGGVSLSHLITLPLLPFIFRCGKSFLLVSRLFL